MQPTFQRATPDDITTLLSLVEQFYAIDRYPFDPTVARAALEPLVSDATLGYVALINDAETTVGYLVLTWGYSLEFHGRDAFVDELFIRDGYRHQGIGTQALHWAETVCQQFGVHALHLEVEHTNDPAQALYRKAGFVDHRRYLMTKWIEQ